MGNAFGAGLDNEAPRGRDVTDRDRRIEEKSHRMTRLNWPGWLIKYRESENAIRTHELTYPSTNRARRRITTLIETNALPQYHYTKPPPKLLEFIYFNKS